MFKTALVAYVLVSASMLITSILTARRAERETGQPHYLLTRMTVLVEQRVEAENATDAALDALFEEAGEPATMTVERPLFVLGLMDATGPFIVGGGVLLGIAKVVARRRRRRAVRGR